MIYQNTRVSERQFLKSYNDLFNIDNFFSAWRIFRKGKANKTDIMNFEMHLDDNIFNLFDDFKNYRYEHSSYKKFQIFDNKKRDINKAQVKDRVVHQIVFDYLTNIFEPTFISESYSSRVGKGQYKAIDNFRYFIKLSTCNNQNCYVLKCDVKKYFDNIDHAVLLNIIAEKIKDNDILEIIKKIISSYHSNSSISKGILLGNITSQIFANIYLDTLDQYVKKGLKCRFFVRYNDDFVIVSDNKKKLEETRNKIIKFVKEKLLLEIPIEKTSIRNILWGVDFLGFIILPKAVLLRNKTKNKIYQNISSNNIMSYLSILKHCNSYHLKRKIFSMDKISRF